MLQFSHGIFLNITFLFFQRDLELVQDLDLEPWSQVKQQKLIKNLPDPKEKQPKKLSGLPYFMPSKITTPVANLSLSFIKEIGLNYMSYPSFKSSVFP